MSIDAVVSKRFAELDEQVNALRAESGDCGFRSYRPEDWRQWASSAHHLLRSVFGEASPHNQNFSTA